MNVVVALFQGPLCGFPNYRKGFGKQVVERLAVGYALFEYLGHLAQFTIAHASEVWFECVDLLGVRLELAKYFAFAGAEDLVEN